MSRMSTLCTRHLPTPVTQIPKLLTFFKMFQFRCKVHQHPGDGERWRNEAPPDPGQRYWHQGELSIVVIVCTFQRNCSSCSQSQLTGQHSIGIILINLLILIYSNIFLLRVMIIKTEAFCIYTENTSNCRVTPNNPDILKCSILTLSRCFVHYNQAGVQ